MFVMSDTCATAGFGLPNNVFRFIFATTALHQVLLSLLTILIFLLELVPLELQRRIVNDLVGTRDYSLIVELCAAYAAIMLGHGGLKFGLNVYRGWVGERIIRYLRRRINALLDTTFSARRGAETSGVGIAVIISEVEPIGGFVGESVSEPLLQTGVLLTVLAYMINLQPWVALAMLAIFSPQFFFVPLMQRAINRRAAARVRTLRGVSTAIISPSGREGQPPTKNESRIDHVFELNMGILRLKFGMNYLMNLTHHIEVAGALLFGGWCVLNGKTEIGTVVAFISAVGRLNDPWGDLVNYFRDVTSTQVKYGLLVDAVNAFARPRKGE